MNYHEAFTELAHVYLEDSWVLNLKVTDAVVSFDLEHVLTDDHPEWSIPKAGNQYCYIPARLELSNYTSIAFKPSSAPPTTDAAGETDYGNIDSFEVAGSACFLSGDWGTLRTEDAAVSLVLNPDSD